VNCVNAKHKMAVKKRDKNNKSPTAITGVPIEFKLGVYTRLIVEYVEEELPLDRDNVVDLRVKMSRSKILRRGRARPDFRRGAITGRQSRGSLALLTACQVRRTTLFKWRFSLPARAIFCITRPIHLLIHLTIQMACSIFSLPYFTTTSCTETDSDHTKTLCTSSSCIGNFTSPT
jgi:hypothetical protein